MTDTCDVDRLNRLICSIRDHAVFDHPVEKFELVETHISFVLLTGLFAYKFKKPVNPGFLDFSTLEKRKFYCEEEVRLNRRYAPAIYLDVVAVTGTEDRPVLNGGGEAIEYAVKMVQFPGGAELDSVLEKGRLTSTHLDNLARQIAKFHETAAVATRESPFGLPGIIRQSTLENFTAIRSHLQDNAFKTQLDQLEDWTALMLDQLSPRFFSRQRSGYVRECHGDLHLGNIALYRDQPVLFDCIEFSEEFRWIDVINEIAFLVMDLEARGQYAMAWRFLNTYLEAGADYEGLQLLRFYCIYRALVRCKIACIRLAQQDLAPLERQKQNKKSRHYLELAGQYTKPPGKALLITHGLSGSGKSTWTQPLLETIGAIRVRSDVERKRLHGLASEARTSSGLEAGIYSRGNTGKTYERLFNLAKVILDAGYPAIVDATFLNRGDRSKFQQLAERLDVPFIILDFQVSEDVLRRRIQERQKTGHDVSEAGLDVLEYQISQRDRLDETESRCTVVMNTAGDIRQKQLDRVIEVLSDLSGIRSR
ncbi:MAG TPA: AAA family ATPase [Gammaproteobacteria bacterium]|nr:AAA family ATPase [Gammaproteobacteria bacterium]